MKSFLAIFLFSLTLLAFSVNLSYGAGVCEPCGSICDTGLTCENGKCHGCPTCPAGTYCFCNPVKYCGIEDIIDKITELIFNLSLIIAPTMMVIGAFLFTTSAGSVEQIDKAKKLMIAAAIGFVITLLAKAITDMILSSIGG